MVRDNLAGGNRVTTGRQVPFCLFTDPELARVGLSEREAREKGIPYQLTKVPMENVLRTRTLSETRGFLKGPGRYGRPHPRVHGIRGGSGGGDGGRPGGDDGRDAEDGTGTQSDTPDYRPRG